MSGVYEADVDEDGSQMMDVVKKIGQDLLFNTAAIMEDKQGSTSTLPCHTHSRKLFARR